MTPAPPPAAFYCVCDARYFLGAVAMVNSLRLHGHTEPIFVLDCGLEPGHRELLAGEATIVAAPPGIAPYLLKTIAPLAHPAQTMVLIDADMIATRPLGELIDRAAEGRVIAFRNDVDRYVSEWGELLELGESRPRPYVSSGLVFLGGAIGAEVLELLDDRQRRVDFSRTYYGSNEPGYPFLFPEQDVLNAILCTRPDPERVVALEHRLAPVLPFAGLRCLDPGLARCAYDDDTEPFVLHHFFRKPWLEAMRSNVYSRLLTRLVLAPDVALRLPPEALPPRLRTGISARLRRLAVDVAIGGPAAIRRRLDSPLSPP